MAQESESRDLDKVIVRLPDGMRDRLKAAAEHNRRSMNAEIVARIQDYDASGLTTGESIGDHIERLNRTIADLRKSERPNLPMGLMSRIDQAATRNNRSVQEEILAALEAAYPVPSNAEVDEIAFNWAPRILAAGPDERPELLREANEELKLTGTLFRMWLGPNRDDGSPTVSLGVLFDDRGK